MLKSLVFVVFCLELLQCASVDKKDRVIRDKKLSEKEHFHEGEEHDIDYDHEAFLGMYVCIF